MISAGQIHDAGHSAFVFPFKVYWMQNDSDTESDTVIISIPKRLFKRAVKRNRLRRRTREALRLQRKNFPNLLRHHLFFVYSSSELLEYGRIYESVGKILETVGQDA